MVRRKKPKGIADEQNKRDAEQWRLEQARQLLRAMGHVQHEDDTWTPGKEQVTRQQLVAAAKDLNKVLGLEPQIDTGEDAGWLDLLGSVLEAAMFVEPQDELKATTRRVLAQLLKEEEPKKEYIVRVEEEDEEEEPKKEYIVRVEEEDDD